MVEDGELYARSKGKEIDAYAVADSKDLFSVACQRLCDEIWMHMIPGVIYRFEYLRKPKHNTLEYERTPERNLVLFDVEKPGQHFVCPDELVSWAREIGVEAVPFLWEGSGGSLDMGQLDRWLSRESFLGGPKIEGVAIKNYDRFTVDGKTMMGKHVSEHFKEKHAGDWKKRNPGRADVVAGIVRALATEARWRKAVERLRDEGGLEGTPRDIGKLIAYVQSDIQEEEWGWVAEKLTEFFERDIKKGATRGLPEWYKRQLAEEQFS
jgi:hypothetical protein